MHVLALKPRAVIVSGNTVLSWGQGWYAETKAMLYVGT